MKYILLMLVSLSCFSCNQKRLSINTGECFKYNKNELVVIEKVFKKYQKETYFGVLHYSSKEYPKFKRGMIDNLSILSIFSILT